MKGSREKNIGPITIGCMTHEARNLLDELCEEYEKQYGKESIHNAGSVYSILYWTCRYSGLVKPNGKKKKS